MRKKELLVVFNNLIEEKNLPLRPFKSWDEIINLHDETLVAYFETFSNLILVEGITNGEINSRGILYEEICDVFNAEIIKRNDLKKMIF